MFVFNALQFHWLSHFLLSMISAFLLSSTAIAQALEAPTSNPLEGSPPRTANGAPQRCGEKCVQMFFDFDGDNRQSPDDYVTPMTILAPTNNQVTVVDNKVVLYVYIPQSTAKIGELTLFQLIPREFPEQRPRYQEVYIDQAVALPETLADGPRIVRFTIEDFKFEPGATYEWSLSLMCAHDIFPLHGYVQGLLTSPRDLQIPPFRPSSSSSQIVRQAQDYVNQNLWNEALNLLAPLHNEEPEAWANLLESEGLGCFKDVPFADEVGVDYGTENDPRCFVDGFRS